MTNRDAAYITKAIDMANHHSSGGSYNMVALWVKGSNVVCGVNSLFRRASTISTLYPDISGFHAELSLYNQTAKGTEMRGGTIYIAGRKECNNAIMMNTRPCTCCTTLLSTTNTKWVVYLKNNQFVKTTINDLIVSYGL